MRSGISICDRRDAGWPRSCAYGDERRARAIGAPRRSGGSRRPRALRRRRDLPPRAPGQAIGRAIVVHRGQLDAEDRRRRATGSRSRRVAPARSSTWPKSSTPSGSNDACEEADRLEPARATRCRAGLRARLRQPCAEADPPPARRARAPQRPRSPLEDRFARSAASIACRCRPNATSSATRSTRSGRRQARRRARQLGIPQPPRRLRARPRPQTPRCWPPATERSASPTAASTAKRRSAAQPRSARYCDARGR